MKNKYLSFFFDNYIIFCVYALIGWIYEVSWYLLVENRFVNRGVLFGPFLPIYGFGILILLFFLRKFMSKKHTINNISYLLISLFTIVTFFVVTFIEYTTDKIYRVDYFLQQYGLVILIVNIFFGFISYFLVKNKKIKNLDVTMVIVFLLIWIITTVIEYVSHYAIDKYSHKMLWDYTYDFLNINKRVNWDASRNFAIGGTFLLYTIQPMLDKFLNKSKFNLKLITCLVVGIPMIIDLIFNVIVK